MLPKLNVLRRPVEFLMQGPLLLSRGFARRLDCFLQLLHELILNVLPPSLLVPVEQLFDDPFLTGLLADELFSQLL